MQLLKGLSELKMTDTATCQEVYAAVKQCDLSGLSFAFKATKGDDRRTGNAHKANAKNRKVYEISIVPFPAYAKVRVKTRSALQDMAKQEKAVTKRNEITARF